MSKTKFLYARCIKNEGKWIANLYENDDPREPILNYLISGSAGTLISLVEQYAEISSRHLVAITLIY
jgi:hypothetical protein